MGQACVNVPRHKHCGGNALHAPPKTVKHLKRSQCPVGTLKVLDSSSSNSNSSSNDTPNGCNFNDINT